MARCLTDIHHPVHITALRRHVVQAQLHPDDTVAARVGIARIGGQQAALAADRALDHICRPGKLLVGKALMHRLHDLLPQHNSGIRARIRQYDLLRVVVAAPDHGRVIRRVTGKPAVKVIGGCACLARHSHAAQLCRSARAVCHGIFQHIIDIPGGHVLHGHMRRLRIVQNDVAACVDDLCVRPRLTVDALVGERGIGGGHCPHRHAVCQSAHRHRREVGVGEHLALGVYIIRYQCTQPHLVLGKGVAVLRRHFSHQLDRHGVERLTHRLIDGNKAAVGRIRVLRPIGTVGKRVWRVIVDARG